jgi:hypothetical protein
MWHEGRAIQHGLLLFSEDAFSACFSSPSYFRFGFSLTRFFF